MGLLYIGDKIIDGALEKITELKSNKTPGRFLTNTTIKSREVLHEKLRALGFNIEIDEIITPIQTSLNFLAQNNNQTIFPVVSEVLKSEFSKSQTSDTPEFIIIGDIGKAWDFALLNDLFLKLSRTLSIES